MRGFLRIFVLLISMEALILENCPGPKTPFDYTQENPLNVISVTATPGYCQDIALMDSLAYVADGEAGVEIVNISNPYSPEIAGYLDEEKDVEIEKVRVVNDLSPEMRLLLTVPSGKRVDFYSLKDPFHPLNFNVNAMSTMTEDLTFLSKNSLGKDSTIFIFTADKNDGLKYNGFQYTSYIFLGDTTWNWFQIDQAGAEYEVRGFPRGVTISDSMVIMASDQGGVDIFRIDDLYSGGLTHLINFDTPGSARHACKVDDYIYVADGRAGLVTYSLENEEIVFVLEGKGYARYISAFDNRLFVAAGDGGLLIADISEKSRPEWIGRADFPYVFMSTHDNNFIYIADRDLGLIIANLK